MNTYGANPHQRYGCAYVRLFDGQWSTQGEGEIQPGDTYGFIVSFVNTTAFAMEARQASLLQGDYLPFPNFSYMLILMRNVHALVLIIGQSPFQGTREAIFRDLSQTPFPRSVDSLVQECEQERGWKNCLPVTFPGNILLLPLEQRTAETEALAKVLAEQLLMQHSERRAYESVPRFHPLASHIADEELRRRCSDLLGAEDDYDRAIAQACLILENRVRLAIGGDATLVGANLMGRAFNVRDGQLRCSEVEAEQQGILFTYQGLIAFFRNSTGHHVVDTYTQHDAFCFVMWVDLLLRLIASAVERSNRTSEKAEQAS